MRKISIKNLIIWNINFLSKIKYVDLLDLVWFQTNYALHDTEIIINSLIDNKIINEENEYLTLHKRRNTLSLNNLGSEIDLKDVLPKLDIPHVYLAKIFEFLLKKEIISASPVSLAKENQSLKINSNWVRFITVNTVNRCK